MDTIPGDKFVADCARFIRYNEAKLGDAASSTSSSLNWMNPAAWLMAGTPPASTNAKGASGSGSRSPLTAHRPMPFRITSHHLYYLLIRCEAIGLPTGPLDVRIPARSRPSSYFAFISSNAAGATYKRRDREETMSINSIQTTMSALGLGGASTKPGSSWWSSEKQDVNADLRYIYSAMTKIPALRVGPPPLKLVRDFEDCPGEMSVPLEPFKNVQILEFEDADPRAFIGWDRLSLQLRSLSMKRSGVEDVTDIIIDAVLADLHRRKGKPGKPRQRKAHSSAETGQLDSAEREGDATTSTEETAEQAAKELPSLAWHFLRHLSLADNSLTFVHPSPISCILNLTSLDLSNNLLNAVPPSLSQLTRLRSLNLSNNLIDSVLGIPDCIPHVHAVNLSHNRLESLCGLERLASLSRIDLRHNEVFEAGEVGRLATLEHVSEVFIAGNPLLEEEEDPRVLVFAEFAKEGRGLDALKLDGESVGYFERQRVRELVPNMDRLVKTRDGQARQRTPSANELARMAVRSSAEHAWTSKPIEEAGTAEGSVIKSVRHRGAGHGARGASAAAAQAAGPHDVRSASPTGAQASQLRTGASQRRNRRVVQLTDSMHEADQVQGQEANSTPSVEESDSDIIKRAALAGDMDVAIGTTFPVQTTTTNADCSAATDETHDDDNTKDRSTISEPKLHKQNGRRSVDDQGQLSDKKAHTKTPGLKQKTDQDKSSEATGMTSQELRRKIEALKGEVGDDWMRLLARGESA